METGGIIGNANAGNDGKAGSLNPPPPLLFPILNPGSPGRPTFGSCGTVTPGKLGIPNPDKLNPGSPSFHAGIPRFGNAGKEGGFGNGMPGIFGKGRARLGSFGSSGSFGNSGNFGIAGIEIGGIIGRAIAGSFGNFGLFDLFPLGRLTEGSFGSSGNLGSCGNLGIAGIEIGGMMGNSGMGKEAIFFSFLSLGLVYLA